MILLVEDDEDVRDMLEFSLASRGFPVTVVANGVAALAAIQQRRPCLVILDLHMPVMTGWELIAELASRGLSDIPICITSALDSRVPPDVVAVLSKPFDTAELLRVANAHCPHATRAG